MPIDRLPTRWRTPAERLRAILLTDAGVMIILGLVFIVRGASYWSLGQSVLVHPADVLVPDPVMSAVWITLGVLLVGLSPWHTSRAGRGMLGVATATLAFWGSLFIFSPPAAFTQRGIIYLGLAGIAIWAVWRGRRGEIRVTEVPHAAGHCTPGGH